MKSSTLQHLLISSHQNGTDKNPIKKKKKKKKEDKTKEPDTDNNHAYHLMTLSGEKQKPLM